MNSKLNNILIVAKLVTFYPLILFLLNLLLKGLFLTSPDIGHDEPFTIYHAQFPVSLIIEQLSGYNNPPLYEILLHYWTEIFGISPLSVRALPLLFGALCPVVLYYFAKRNYSLTTGIVSSLLMSFSTLLVYYSHDSRAYTLFLLLAIAAMYYFSELVYQPWKLVSGILFIVFGALMVYAHYFGFIVFFIQGVFLVFFARQRLVRLLLTYAGIVILYIPQFWTMFDRFHTSVSGTWLDQPQGIADLYNMLWSFSNYPFVTVYCIFVLVATAVVTVVKRTYVNMNRSKLLVVLWFFVPFFGMFLLSYRVPMYISRYLIFVLPAWYLLLSMAIDHLITKKKARLAVMASLILCFAFTIQLDPDKKRSVKPVADLAKEYLDKDPDAAILLYPSDHMLAFAYHATPEDFKNVADGKEYQLLQQQFHKRRIYTVSCYDDAAIASRVFSRVAFLNASGDCSESEFQRAIAEQGHQVIRKFKSGSYCVTVYKKERSPH